MLAVWFGGEEHPDGAVLFGIQHFHQRARISRAAFAVEDRAGVVLLRLMVEDQDDLAARVERGVVVIAEFRGGNSEAGEGYRPKYRGFEGRSTEEIDAVFQVAARCAMLER